MLFLLLKVDASVRCKVEIATLEPGAWSYLIQEDDVGMEFDMVLLMMLR